MEIGHRSNSACVIGAVAMELNRPLHWDVRQECFVDDPQANRLLGRPAQNEWNV